MGKKNLSPSQIAQAAFNARIKHFTKVCFSISKTLTTHYSTSFSIATRLFPKQVREAIYGIYGFVRIADEIVDTFHYTHQQELLEEFEKAYYESYQYEMSTNPIIHAFLTVVRKYNIENELVQAFFESMKKDLKKVNYFSHEQLNAYVYGSADVVGLMCLKVFCDGDERMYESLSRQARRLASAFQKVNFLRDLYYDKKILNRNYFPMLYGKILTEKTKKAIICDIENDFQSALEGIRRLPKAVKVPVYVAFLYYRTLLRKLSRTPVKEFYNKRTRISNFFKVLLLLRGWVTCKMGII